MRKLLVSLKGELCKIAQEMEKKRDRSVYLTEEDKIDARHGKTEIDYLLHLIDGFLLGYYEPSDDNISDFTESKKYKRQDKVE